MDNKLYDYVLNDFETFSLVSDLVIINVNESSKELVYLPDMVNPNIEFRIPKYLSISDNNNEIRNLFFYGRKEIAEKLDEISKELLNINKDASLVVSNVYRHPKIQEENFKKVFNDIKAKFPLLSQDEQIEKTHLMIAYPKVAGHTTGGAIDLSIKIGDTLLDMGCEIGDFDKEEYLPVKNSYITKEQFENRLMLRKLMIRHEFAPFNGEWWHFSFGDREWAKIYNKEYAIYDVVNNID
ncbi:MAG: M15 family metallopeptidase [Bdellovibrionota bacterium]|nr:M15 family metallopeptidase [Pseudomonadota bacterium]MDY6090150.1 M15 family metallopeptidase [Bdellovibrionota bacterium]